MIITQDNWIKRY